MHQTRTIPQNLAPHWDESIGLAPAWTRSWVLGPVLYFGDMALLLAAALSAPFRPRAGQPRLTAVVSRQFESILLGGLPLIATIHLGFGSFLAMQAFFRATIAEANGAVVGLGMMRSVAPMLTGVCMAWVLSVRCHAELGGGLRRGLDDDPADVPDRDQAEDLRPVPEVGRVVFARVAAAMLAGPLLTAWGATVGFFMGAVVSRRMMGLTPGTYFGFFFEMLQVPDVLSLLVTGSGFALAAALSACRESLRTAPVVPRDGPVPMALYCPASIGRAVLYAVITMLVMNAAWFTLAYQAGAPFGPHMVATSATD